MQIYDQTYIDSLDNPEGLSIAHDSKTRLYKIIDNKGKTAHETKFTSYHQACVVLVHILERLVKEEPTPAKPSKKTK